MRGAVNESNAFSNVGVKATQATRKNKHWMYNGGLERNNPSSLVWYVKGVAYRYYIDYDGWPDKLISNIIFLQCEYILIMKVDSLVTGNVFKKLKQSYIIIGCWNIHWKCTSAFAADVRLSGYFNMLKASMLKGNTMCMATRQVQNTKPSQERLSPPRQHILWPSQLKNK